MKVGDLVRWTMFGDLGIIISVMKGYWKPYYNVYLILDGQECSIRADELELVDAI